MSRTGLLWVKFQSSQRPSPFWILWPECTDHRVVTGSALRRSVVSNAAFHRIRSIAGHSATGKQRPLNRSAIEILVVVMAAACAIAGLALRRCRIGFTQAIDNCIIAGLGSTFMGRLEE